MRIFDAGLALGKLSQVRINALVILCKLDTGEGVSIGPGLEEAVLGLERAKLAWRIGRGASIGETIWSLTPRGQAVACAVHMLSPGRLPRCPIHLDLPCPA